jgi:hypothetical protein
MGLWILSVIRNSKQLEKTTFRKLDFFPSSGERRETPTLLGRLETANRNHWATILYNQLNKHVTQAESKGVNREIWSKKL